MQRSSVAWQQPQEKRVAPLELFFDLVFVFAITQVTALMSHDPTLGGPGPGMLILSALWWAWAAYAWLTNYIAAEEDRERLLMLAVMGAFLVAALAVPEAFGDHALLFALAYAAARWLHLHLRRGQRRRRRRRGDPAAVPHRAARAAAPDRRGVPRRRRPETVVWVARPLDRLRGPYVFGVARLPRVPGPLRRAVLADRDHRAGRVDRGDRHRPGHELDAGTVTAALLGLVLAFGLWWAYFDVVAIVAERHFREAQGMRRLKLARDSYSYLHLPMIAGIVLVALGVKKAARRMWTSR